MEQEILKDTIVEALTEYTKNKENAEKEKSMIPRVIEIFLIVVVLLIPTMQLIPKLIIEIEGQYNFTGDTEKMHYPDIVESEQSIYEQKMKRVREYDELDTRETLVFSGFAGIILFLLLLLFLLLIGIGHVLSHSRKEAMEWNMFLLGILSIEIMLMTK